MAHVAACPGNTAAADVVIVDGNKEYRAFERLPRIVREALRNAVYDWSALDVQRARRHGAKAADLVKFIVAWDDLERRRNEALLELSTAGD